jgi:hypothetical protein
VGSLLGVRFTPTLVEAREPFELQADVVNPLGAVVVAVGHADEEAQARAGVRALPTAPWASTPVLGLRLAHTRY